MTEATPDPDVWRLADLLTPMAIRVAATLGLADHLAAGRRTATEIAAASDADADALDRLLRHLAASDLVVARPDGYELTELGAQLRADHPSGAASRLDIDGPLGRADLSFVHLLHSIRTGRAAFPEVHGTPFWADLGADADRRKKYDALMGDDVDRWADDLVPAFDWASLGHLVDVGGGDGTLLARLLVANPTLRGTVVEQEGTASSARAALAGRGVGDRGDVIVGNFFERLPSGAGGYLLCAVLHDWSDGDAVAILRRCREAAAPDGRVLVVEKTGPDRETPPTEMDLRMLVYFGGRERGATALAELAEQAGLHPLGVHRAGALSLIELAVAGSADG